MIITLLFLIIPISIVSVVDEFIKAETSIILFTSLPLIDLIMSPDLIPEFEAGVST